MVWTTCSPVEPIPWAAGTVVVHGISYPVDDTYPVDNMAYPVDTCLCYIPWVYPVDTLSYPVGCISRGHTPWTTSYIQWGAHPVDILWTYSVDNIKISRGCQIMLYPVGT